MATYQLNATWKQVDDLIPIEAETANRTIYVQSATDPTNPGNDETGDGTSVSTAFATLKRAIEDIKINLNAYTVTIQIGEGTFNIVSNDFYRLYLIHGYPGIIRIYGSTTSVKTGFTASKNVTNPFKWDISGGGMTINEFQDGILQKGSNYYRIHSNDADTVTIGECGTKPAGANAIYSASTIFQSSEISTIFEGEKMNVNLEWYFCDFDLQRDISIGSTGLPYVYFIGNKVTTHYTNQFGFCATVYGNGKGRVRGNAFIGDGCGGFQLINEGVPGNFEGCYIKRIGTNTYPFGIRVNSRAKIKGTSVLIDNMYYGIINVGQIDLSEGVAFYNVTRGFTISALSDLFFVSGQQIVCDNLYELVTYDAVPQESNTIIDYNNIIEITPITNLTNNPINMFYRPDLGFIGYLKNLDKIEQNLINESLINGANSVTIGNVSQNRQLNFNFTITDGTNIETGEATIFNDGSTLNTLYDSQVSGVAFTPTFTISGGDIVMNITTTATGNLYGQINRVMI